MIVLYSLGYILRPGTVGELAKAGSIYLSSQPSGAIVYVNKRRFAEKTPATVQGLLPGTYKVKVVLKGYQPWEGIVPVRAEEASVFDDIVLYPNNSGSISSAERLWFDAGGQRE